MLFPLSTSKLQQSLRLLLIYTHKLTKHSKNLYSDLYSVLTFVRYACYYLVLLPVFLFLRLPQCPDSALIRLCNHHTYLSSTFSGSFPSSASLKLMAYIPGYLCLFFLCRFYLLSIFVLMGFSTPSTQRSLPCLFLCPKYSYPNLFFQVEV